MARETLPVALEFMFGDEGNHPCWGTFRFQGAHRRRSAMRPDERVKIIEWTAALAAAAFVAALVVALVS